MQKWILLAIMFGALVAAAPLARAGETTAPIAPVKPIPPMKPIPEMQPVQGVHPIPHVKPIPPMTPISGVHHKRKPKPVHHGRRRSHNRCHSTDTCTAPAGATCECHCEGTRSVCTFHYGGKPAPD